MFAAGFSKIEARSKDFSFMLTNPGPVTGLTGALLQNEFDTLGRSKRRALNVTSFIFLQISEPTV